jgi:hypothetical protein
VGALHLLGISDTIQAGSHVFPPDVLLAERAMDQSPDCIIDMDKPNWGENAVGAALGMFHSAQLCHNHFHRSTNMKLCCGMAEPDMGEERQDNLFNLTNAIYYSYLNCGFKLAATGGSAMGVMPSPLGYNRTYAKLTGPLNEQNYLEAIRHGRTFATSGPILFLSAEDKIPGDSIFISSQNGEVIHGKMDLGSIDPIRILNLIHNGEIVQQFEFDNRSVKIPYSKVIEFELQPERSGWIAAQAVYRNSGNGQLRQAHTSPIYVLVDQKPIAFKKDAEFMIRWVDKLVTINQTQRQYHSELEKGTVLELYMKARKTYTEIAAKAERIWND